MALLNEDRQKFVRAAGILILIQGLAWFALAVAGIVVKNSPPESMSKEITEYTTYSQYLSRIIYDDFMSDKNIRQVNKVIRPQDFEVFLWIYAVLSAVWVTAALDQNFAIRYKKNRQSLSTLVLGSTILLTSVIDLVFFALLARDLSTCPFEVGFTDDLTTLTPVTTTTPSSTSVSTSTASTVTTTTTVSTPSTTQETSPDLMRFAFQSTIERPEIDCQVSNGIVMSMAARGYVLWFINIVVAIVLISIGVQASRGASNLMTYERNTIPRAKIPGSRKAPSPNSEVAIYGDNNEVFMPPAPPMNGSKNQPNIPVALANKNQGIFY